MVISLLGGFGAGIVASYVVWMLTAKVHLPRLEVSGICRDFRSRDPEVYRYRIKVRNPSRRRSVGDISLAARLVVRGLDPDRRDTYTTFRLRMADEHPFPVLEPGEGRILTLRLSELEGDGRAHLPEAMHVRIAMDQISLEELMGLGTSAFVRFAVTGSHEIGGLYRTKTRRYVASDIVAGRFGRQDSVEIRQGPDVSLLVDDSDASEPTGL